MSKDVAAHGGWAGVREAVLRRERRRRLHLSRVLRVMAGEVAA